MDFGVENIGMFVKVKVAEPRLRSARADWPMGHTLQLVPTRSQTQMLKIFNFFVQILWLRQEHHIQLCVRFAAHKEEDIVGDQLVSRELCQWQKTG